METPRAKFKTYLQATAVEIEKELKKIEKELRKESTNDFGEIDKLKKRFSESWLGGKMLRGTLVKLGYELGYGKQIKAIWKPAAAFEILHTALLVHDDIIDQSTTRRGKLAMHVHPNNHYGISQAICLGDLGISLAGKLIAESDFPSKNKSQALAYFFEIVNQTILGEMMDVASSQRFERTEKQILEIHTMKTANYTLIGPLTLGAILAGAKAELLNKITLFAKPLGIAFQIQDDVMGVFGDEKVVGKSTTSDIEENKSTLLISYALEHANSQQKQLLNSYYGKKSVTKKELEIVKEIFRETGALRYSENKIKNLLKKPKMILPQMKIKEKEKNLLLDFIEMLVAREK